MPTREQLETQIRELRQQIQENRQKTFEVKKRALSDTAQFLQRMFDPSPEYMHAAFELVLYVDTLGKPLLRYAVVDQNTAEHYGSFELEVTDVCDYDEIELVVAAWDENDEAIMRGAVQHIIKRLGAQRVIYTVTSNDEGTIEIPTRRVDGWMDYLETRPADAERSRFVDVYTWEVPQV